MPESSFCRNRIGRATANSIRFLQNEDDQYFTKRCRMTFFYYTSVFTIVSVIWTAARQNQQNEQCVPAQSDQRLLLSASRNLGTERTAKIHIRLGILDILLVLSLLRLLFSFNAHKTVFLLFQRHVQLFRTRARARKDTNTHGRRHFLMHKNNLRLWQWYKAKSMDHEIYVTDPHIVYKVDLWVTLIHYPKYNTSPSNSLQDMKQNRWTIKYRSLTYIYLIRSIYVSHWSIIRTMMFIIQIILTILSKITRPWNVGHVDLYYLWGQSLGHTVSLSEYMTLMDQIVLEI